MTRDTDYLLARLERLIDVRTRRRGELNALGVRIVDRCIRATAADLQDFGRGEEAGERLYGLCLALASAWVE